MGLVFGCQCQNSLGERLNVARELASCAGEPLRVDVLDPHGHMLAELESKSLASVALLRRQVAVAEGLTFDEVGLWTAAGQEIKSHVDENTLRDAGLKGSHAVLVLVKRADEQVAKMVESGDVRAMIATRTPPGSEGSKLERKETDVRDLKSFTELKAAHHDQAVSQGGTRQEHGAEPYYEEEYDDEYEAAYFARVEGRSLGYDRVLQELLKADSIRSWSSTRSMPTTPLKNPKSGSPLSSTWSGSQKRTPEAGRSTAVTALDDENKESANGEAMPTYRVVPEDHRTTGDGEHGDYIDVMFWNDLPVKVDLQWVGFQGRHIDYATIPPSASFKVQTLPKHVWKIVSVESSQDFATLEVLQQCEIQISHVVELPRQRLLPNLLQ